MKFVIWLELVTYEFIHFQARASLFKDFLLFLPHGRKGKEHGNEVEDGIFCTCNSRNNLSHCRTDRYPNYTFRPLALNDKSSCLFLIVRKLWSCELVRKHEPLQSVTKTGSSEQLPGTCVFTMTCRFLKRLEYLLSPTN